MTQPDLDASLAHRLKNLRSAIGLSAAALDARAGFYSGTTRRLERGTQRIYAAHLYRVAHATGVPVDYFYEQPSTTDTQPLPNDREAENHRFLRTFLRIQDPALKRTVFDLIKSLVDTPETDDI